MEVGDNLFTLRQKYFRGIRVILLSILQVWATYNIPRNLYDTKILKYNSVLLCLTHQKKSDMPIINI